MRVTKYLLTALTVILLASCSNCSEKKDNVSEQPYVSTAPTFNVDSAFAYVKAQCAFGPRVMNSAAHDSCGDYIVSQFKKYGGEVYEQFADLKLYDGTPIKKSSSVHIGTPVLGQTTTPTRRITILQSTVPTTAPAAWVCCWSWHGYSPRPLLQWVWTSSALMPKMLELQNGTSRATTLRAHGALVRSIGQASITSRAMWLIMRFCSTW